MLNYQGFNLFYNFKSLLRRLLVIVFKNSDLWRNQGAICSWHLVSNERYNMDSNSRVREPKDFARKILATIHIRKEKSTLNR